MESVQTGINALLGENLLTVSSISSLLIRSCSEQGPLYVVVTIMQLQCTRRRAGRLADINGEKKDQPVSLFPFFAANLVLMDPVGVRRQSDGRMQPARKRVDDDRYFGIRFGEEATVRQQKKST